MKRLVTILLLFSLLITTSGQQDLKQRLETTTNDTLRLKLLGDLTFSYVETNSDSAYYYGDQTTILCRKLGYRLSEAFAMNFMGYALMNKGNYPRALQVLLTAFEIANDPQSDRTIPPQKYLPPLGADSVHNTPGFVRLQTLAWLHYNMGALNENAGNAEKEMLHYSESLQLAEQSGTIQVAANASMALARLFLTMKKPDSALIYAKKAHEISKHSLFQKYGGSVLLNLGRVYLAMGDRQQALYYIRQAIFVSEQQKYFRGAIAGNLLLADVSVKSNTIDSAFYFVEKSRRLAEQLNAPDLLLRCYTALAGLYKLGNKNDSTVKYQGLIIQIKDTLFNTKQAQQFRNIDSDAEQREREIETAKKDYRNRLQKIALISGLAAFLFAAIVLWHNNRNKQRAYALLTKQKQETDFQKAKVEQALDELKSTQAQLVQREKMASLGELTAGIAHEIQNPLNFVNNFSDVNKELADELEQEINKGNYDDAKTIAKDIRENEEKINHHGKRADAIVKGMLQHSRTSTGQKEPTDLNVLAEEYSRLAYHGFTAKDISLPAGQAGFNAIPIAIGIKTDFDNGIDEINIIPQEIGRVVLNLINNACYAVSEKAKKNIVGYGPIVTISTKKVADKVELRVTDNGPGIPQKILDKIFQPFFTTKPTGQGTGLGLSLAYDIVKSHGGELKVETQEGEGSTFTIQFNT